MRSLLGLKFLNSKSKLQNHREEEEAAPRHRDGKQKTAQKKAAAASGERGAEAGPPSPAFCFSDAASDRLEKSALARPFLLLTGVLSTQKKLSSCLEARKGGLLSEGSSVTRRNFAAAKSACSDEIFTNNESLPCMKKAYAQFKGLYPEYLSTREIDRLRAREYRDLDERAHVFLDYSGYGLFSKWQEKCRRSSASFGLSYISVSLFSHALYGGADEGTAEYDIKQTILEFLNIQESEYAIVFTASRGSAFKLLGESYPFHLNKRLLSVYDYASDAISRLEEVAQRNGAKIMSAQFRWPSQRLWATDLKNKLLEKKRDRREGGKGLFVFPVQSRVTGAKYSYQWMSQAQENGWDILLDASALGPNAMATLGLSVFRPDFIVSSFFKVYGSDPTGFGCLLIKQSAIQKLHSSSAARGVGMVRLVPTLSLPERLLKAGDVREMEIVVADSARYTERRQTCSSERACMAGAFPITNDTFVSSSHKEERSGLVQVSASVRSSPSSKRYEVREYEASSSSASVLEKNFPTCSLYPARTGHDEASARFCIMLSEKNGRTGLDSNLRPPADDFPHILPERIGQHAQTLVSSSTLSSESPGVRGQEVSSSNRRTPTSDPPAHKVSYKPQEQESNALSSDTRSFQISQVKTGDGFSPRPIAQQMDELSSGESRSSTGFDSSNRIDSGHLRTSLNQSRPSYVCSLNGQHDDLPLPHAYMEDMPSAFVSNDKDFEDVSDASTTGEEEEEEQRRQEDGEPVLVERKEPEIQCRGLYHAHKLGLTGTNIRLRCLANWLIAAMLKLQHPGTPTSHSLVQIYGPKVDYERGASVSFNLTDWKGDFIQPLLVQRLADRSNISIGVTTLSHIYVPKNSAKWSQYLEHIKSNDSTAGHSRAAVSVDKSSRLDAITIALCFLSNFKDVYRFWQFLANFLDADFVSKEGWRYRSLNQATIMLGVQEPRNL